jgi:hypothetical protein
MTIRNGQSRDIDIDMHIAKMLEMWHSGMDNLETLTWYTQEKDVRDGTIRNGQSRETDIDIHKKKTLEIGQSGMDNLPDCPISNVFFLCMSISVSLDCPFLIVPSLTSFSCVYQVNVSWFLIPDCHISKVFFLCMSISVSLDCPFLIDLFLTFFFNGQSTDTDIDMHIKKRLEMWHSGMDNLETLTLTYTRKRR